MALRALDEGRANTSFEGRMARHEAAQLAALRALGLGSYSGQASGAGSKHKPGGREVGYFFCMGIQPMSDSKIRVLVVDDHPVLRDGVAAILENQADMIMIGEARDGREAVELFRSLLPDVTLMDLQMPVMNGVDAITEIRSIHAGAKIIVLTTYAGDAQAVRALRAGAVGYLLKSGLRTDMIDAIHDVHRGQRHVHRDIADEIALHVVDEPLTGREIQILCLVSVGKGNRQVACELGLSEETVKGHLKNVFAKLGVADRTHAVTVAARRGIIDI